MLIAFTLNIDSSLNGLRQMSEMTSWLKGENDNIILRRKCSVLIHSTQLFTTAKWSSLECNCNRGLIVFSDDRDLRGHRKS